MPKLIAKQPSLTRGDNEIGSFGGETGKENEDETRRQNITAFKKGGHNIMAYDQAEGLICKVVKLRVVAYSAEVVRKSIS